MLPWLLLFLDIQDNIYQEEEAGHELHTSALGTYVACILLYRSYTCNRYTDPLGMDLSERDIPFQLYMVFVEKILKLVKKSM